MKKEFEIYQDNKGNVYTITTELEELLLKDIVELSSIIKEFEEKLEKERKIDRPRDDYNYGVSNTLDYMWYELQKIKGSDNNERKSNHN